MSPTSLILPSAFTAGHVLTLQSCIFITGLGFVILLILILVQSHKRAVGSWGVEKIYKLEVGKAAWVVGGWVVLLVVYQGRLLMMRFELSVWIALLFDVVYL